MERRAKGLDHAHLWSAIDAIAAAAGLSPSGLARRAGLSSTAFNRSKRVTADGRPRWPSTESIAKVLEATDLGLDDLVRLIRGEGAPPSPAARRLPVLAPSDAASGFAESTAGGIDFADLGPAGLFACPISGVAEAGPYRCGDVVVASREVAPRRGDRVLVMTRDGRLVVRAFLSRNGRSCELAPACGRRRRSRLPVADVLWIARILWASQ